jgi:Domain of unknown function (DUF4159)
MVGFLRRHLKTAAFAVVALTVVDSALAQRRGGGFYGYRMRLPPNPAYDGAFQYCRGMYQRHPQGDGGGWLTDYPQADENLPFRFSELTRVSVSRDPAGKINHTIVALGDPALYRCPIVIMQEVGSLYLDDDDAAHLRDYLTKGGFLWVDDFWGEYAWTIWESQIRKALPSGEFPMIDLPLDHPLFHVLYEVQGVAQIPAINFWLGTGGQTSERGPDSRVPHARAILDGKGHVLVLMTHNTDYGDAFEREGENRAYFERFAGLGYAFGINALLYAMSH